MASQIEALCTFCIRPVACSLIGKVERDSEGRIWKHFVGTCPGCRRDVNVHQAGRVRKP